MQIRYVVSSMIFWWRENHLSFEQECQFLKSQGFGIELWPSIKGHDECRFDRRNWPRLQAATEGMLVSMRSGYSKNGGLKLDKWAEQIECAQLLRANIVTDMRSLGAAPGLNGSGLTDEVINLAKEKQVTICVETGQLDQLKQLCDKYESLKVCLDTGYAHLDSRFPFRQYVDELIDKVAHLHLTDNYGQADDHEPPGLKGGIPREDWQYLLDTIDKSGHEVIGSLEMCPCMPAVMLRKATEFLFDELNWPNQPQAHRDQPFAAYDPI